MRLPHSNEKACAFAYDDGCFYEATFLCGLHFPIHPFILELLDHLKVGPGQIVSNAWRTIVSCMSIWTTIQEGDMIKVNEFVHLYHLKPSTHYGYFELLP